MHMIGKIFAAIGVVSIAAVAAGIYADRNKIRELLNDVREKREEMDEDDDFLFDDDYDDFNDGCEDCGCGCCPFKENVPNEEADRKTVCRVIDNADEAELQEIADMVEAAQVERLIVRDDINQKKTANNANNANNAKKAATVDVPNDTAKTVDGSRSEEKAEPQIPASRDLAK